MDDLSICMRCGFCQAKCPVFEETKQEPSTARGRIAIINSLFKGETEPSSGVMRRVFECNLCGRCKEACPAGVDTIEIFLEGRRRLQKNTPIKRRLAYNIIEHPRLLSLGGNMGFVLGLRDLKITKPTIHKVENPKMKVVFFPGCLGKHFLKDLVQSSIEVLELNNIEVKLVDEDCCGAPLYLSGADERANTLARKNIEKIKAAGADVIVTACPTCKSGLERYPRLFKGEENSEIKKFFEHVYEISEFLEEVGHTPPKTKINKTITHHEACHTRNNAALIKSTQSMMNGIHGPRLVELSNPSSCCGFGGFFMLDNPEISRELKRKKIDDIKSTEAQTVLTSCPGCIMFIGRALKGSGIRVQHPIQLLREAYKKESII